MGKLLNGLADATVFLLLFAFAGAGLWTVVHFLLCFVQMEWLEPNWRGMRIGMAAGALLGLYIWIKPE